VTEPTRLAAISQSLLGPTVAISTDVADDRGNRSPYRPIWAWPFRAGRVWNRDSMTMCTVTVATYRLLAPALADWDALVARDQAGELTLVDAALVEGDVDTLHTIHRHPRSGCSRGAAAGAMVGLLRPPALVMGAVAGGVGDRMIVALAQGLSRDDLKYLGDLFDTEPISIVVLSTSPEPMTWSTVLGAATATASVDTHLSADQIRRAVEADEAEV
jgi:hypothetical protein